MSTTQNPESVNAGQTQPTPEEVLASVLSSYDTALGSVLQQATRKTGPKVTFESLATARAAGQPFLKAFIDADVAPTKIKVDGRSIVATLPHGYLRQDVEAGTFHVHVATYHGKTRSMAPSSDMTALARYMVETPTPQDALRLYAQDIAPHSRLLGIANGAIEADVPEDPHRIYDALFTDLLVNLGKPVPDAETKRQLGHDVIEGLLAQKIEIKRLRPSSGSSSVIIEMDKGALRQRQDLTFDGYHFAKGEHGTCVGPEKMSDAAAVVKCYLDDIVPAALVQLRLEADAERRDEERLLERTTREERIVNAYETMDPQIKKGIKDMLAFISLGEMRHGGGIEGMPFGRRGMMHHPMDGGPPIATALLWQLEALEERGMPPARGERRR
jgi:hypothetical protein